MRFARLLPLTLAVSVFFVAVPVFAADCPSGTAPATAADVVKMKAAGIQDAVVGMCWNGGDQNVGETDAQAKQYLRGILCSPDADNYGGEGPDGTIQGLDAKFAVCAASFLKSVQQNGIQICIREGKRSVAKQDQYAARYRAGGSIACTKGAGCEHPRGIAIDVNTNSMANYDRIHQMAPNFGLIFYLPVKDKVHFVPMKGGCSAGGTAPSNGVLPPTYYDFPQDYTPATLPNSSLPFSPMTPLSTGFSSGLSMTPQITPSSYANNPATNPALSTSPTQNTCAPSFSCSNNVQYYQTSSCTNQVYQVCSNGCNGNVCAAASSTGNYINNSFGTTSSSSASTDTNTNTNTNVNSDGNVSDILNSIATNFTAVNVATTSSIAFSLNPDTGEVGQIATEGAATSGLSSGGIGVISSVQPTVGGQQTFTSGDLTGSGTLGGTQNRSGLAAILASMRSALEWAIKVLTPFGGAPRTTY